MRNLKCDSCGYDEDQPATPWREIVTEGGTTFDVCFMCVNRSLHDLEERCIENLLSRFDNSVDRVGLYMERHGSLMTRPQLAELRKHLTRLSFQKHRDKTKEGRGYGHDESSRS